METTAKLIDYLPAHHRTHATVTKVLELHCFCDASQKADADLASRGKSTTELFTLDIWWHGLHWLADGDHASPWISFLSKSVDATVIDQITSEEKVSKVCFETPVLAPEVAGTDLDSFTMPFEVDQK
ncbi:unnamed protein product, partial [Didymodactylos carnosus]